MNKALLGSSLLLVAALLAPGAAGDAGTVTVTVSVGDHYHLLPAGTTCTVSVAEGARAGDALDAAVASGCIGSWSYNAYEGFGRYVTEIDGRAEDGTFYWVFSHNGATAAYGIDADEAIAQEGAEYDFRYGTLPSFFLP